MLFRSAYRVLKKGGCLFSFDPNAKNWAMWLHRSARSFIRSAKGRTENEEFFSSEQLDGALKLAGFREINVQAVSGVPFRYVESALMRSFLPLYNVIDFILGLTPPAKDFGSFIAASAVKGY